MTNSTGEWTVQPEAEKFLKQFLENAFQACPAAKAFAYQMRDEVAVRMRDLIDHVKFKDPDLVHKLEKVGWKSDVGGRIYRNLTGFFPTFILSEKEEAVCFRVESLEDFKSANHLAGAIDGDKWSQFRKMLAYEGKGIDFWAVERHGTDTFEVLQTNGKKVRAARLHLQSFL